MKKRTMKRLVLWSYGVHSGPQGLFLSSLFLLPLAGRLNRVDERGGGASAQGKGGPRSKEVRYLCVLATNLVISF